MAICEAPWLQMSPRYKCLKRTPPATIQLPLVPGDIATPTPSHSALCVVRTVVSVVPSCVCVHICGSPCLQMLVQNVPRCDVMCCDVPCCALSCFAELFVLCRVSSSIAVRCCAVPRQAVLCCAVPRQAVLCHAMLCCGVLCCAVLSHTVPCGAGGQAGLQGW